ncbi:MAG: hypothetical protein ABIG43_06945 [Chloroflexota bacterium]
MDIKDFIKTSLSQIASALDESGKELKKKVKLTNTVLRMKGQGNYGLIEFDLAVEAKESKTSGKGGGVRISVVEARIGKDSEITSSTVSRVRFKVEANF